MAFRYYVIYSYNIGIKALSKSCNSNSIKLNIIYNKSKDTKVLKNNIKYKANKVNTLSTIQELGLINIYIKKLATLFYNAFSQVFK